MLVNRRLGSCAADKVAGCAGSNAHVLAPSATFQMPTRVNDRTASIKPRMQVACCLRVDHTTLLSLSKLRCPDVLGKHVHNFQRTGYSTTLEADGHRDPNVQLIEQHLLVRTSN